MLDKYIEELRPYVIELFDNDSSGHDITHLERTMQIALYISSKEGGDRLIIGIAAFLHDVHRIMQNKVGEYVSPKDSLPKIKELLSHVDLTNEQKDKICYAIEHHEEYSWSENKTGDINSLILQDADNMDAIGAIGIGRLFVYGGAHNIPMYEDVPLNINNDYAEEKGDSESSIHHCYHKLFKLADNMNTKTGKELATERVEFMKDFIEEFLKEWNFNYKGN